MARLLCGRITLAQIPWARPGADPGEVERGSRTPAPQWRSCTHSSVSPPVKGPAGALSLIEMPGGIKGTAGEDKETCPLLLLSPTNPGWGKPQDCSFPAPCLPSGQRTPAVGNSYTECWAGLGKAASVGNPTPFQHLVDTQEGRQGAETPERGGVWGAEIIHWCHCPQPWPSLQAASPCIWSHWASSENAVEGEGAETCFLPLLPTWHPTQPLATAPGWNGAEAGFLGTAAAVNFQVLLLPTHPPGAPTVLGQVLERETCLSLALAPAKPGTPLAGLGRSSPGSGTPWSTRDSGSSAQVLSSCA